MGSDYNSWSITPTVTSFLGTQNFYQGYYQNRKFDTGNNKGRGKKKNSNTTTQPTIVQVEGSSKFTILDYELSTPINYDNKDWGFFLVPTYAIPVHPITYTLPNGNTFNVEKLKNVFFIELGGYVKF